MSTKKLVKKLRRELRAAYVSLDYAPADDENEHQRLIGRYYGLRRAYSVVTGLDEIAVGSQVVSWYVRSEHYTCDPDPVVFGPSGRKVSRS